MTPEKLKESRKELLDTVLAYFKADPGVLAVFLAGSIAAGSDDEYSDIDLRVVAVPERHAYFVDQRREIPKRWPGFLFNEWVANTQHCVSHFKPFGKIDIFYYSSSALHPSPWYRLPIVILHDPEGIVARLITQSANLKFAIEESDMDFSISKGLAAAHETYRRAMRGELFYAQSLLNEFRQHIMHADDWLHDRTPETAVMAKFDARASPEIRSALKSSYCPCEAGAILASLQALVSVYGMQVQALHGRFALSRPIANDLAALKIVG